MSIYTLIDGTSSSNDRMLAIDSNGVKRLARMMHQLSTAVPLAFI